MTQTVASLNTAHGNAKPHIIRSKSTNLAPQWAIFYAQRRPLMDPEEAPVWPETLAEAEAQMAEMTAHFEAHADEGVDDGNQPE